tara:strand:- start:327 stop:623 length:297 start_codon:yes stop_codon:yes gene_type:complete
VRVAAGTYTTRGMLESRYEETINNDIQLFVQAHNNIPSVEKIKFPLNKKSATKIFNQLRKGSEGKITDNNYVCSPVHIRRVKSALARLGFKERKKNGS